MQHLIRARTGTYADAAFAAFVMAAVGLMIVPVPTYVLDILLSTNLAMAVLLLLVSLYVTEPLRISTFPAILLTTTLFRLALNISSTRLILAHADAGRVIDAFGHIVVQDNYVVGAVVFAILVVIQLVVIAKGAERVSEVAARFVLDAMPGQQLAIDAELRTGAIDLEEAQRSRRRLQRESQFYGAMDGAMKFVKGDAVAGLIIIAVNVVAGMFVGVAQHGMSALEAAQTYVLLSIGDGVASQIPALLLATSAAVVVTRVSALETRTSLGEEIVAQLSGHPRALGIAAGFLAALAMVPGLPGVPFIGVAGICAWGARRSWRHQDRRSSDSAVEPRLKLRLGAAVAEELGVRGIELLSRSFESMGSELEGELGIRIPRLAIVPAFADRRAWELALDGVPLGRGTVRPGREALPFLVGEGDRLVRERAGEFIDQRTTRDALRQTDSTIVDAVVPAVVDMRGLTDVLQNLVSEGVSVGNPRRILSILAKHGEAGPPLDLTQTVREGLGRSIASKYTTADGVLDAYIVDVEIEEMVAGAVRRSGRRTHLALPPSVAREIIEAVKRSVDADVREGMLPVLVTDRRARSHLRRLLVTELPAAVILASQELDAAVRIEPRGHIRVGRTG